ncbi:uncharacterized protein E5676_scaffold455G00660 [Cucumis melo var. makuwa]|uniref:CACTA en-spm transposon protein n=1 Tax=Cucumis melo var. makuwa TaxID=1194695 RepID=A0A5D3E5E2_CUCMM|nr:uncharacterized protein E5676_scaffold455G00660 [Cucumis melo var. makuwa]
MVSIERLFKRIWYVPEVDDVEDQQLNIPEIVVGHRVANHIEDDTLCTMSNFPVGFDESGSLFDFNIEEFNNVGGTSSVGDTSDASQPTTRTPRRREHSRSLE